jgi:hypothetical protein
MEEPFIFGYKKRIVISWGLTKMEKSSLEMIRDLSCKAVLIRKSVRAFN